MSCRPYESDEEDDPRTRSPDQRKIIRHQAFCGCNDPEREEKLYPASKKLASEMGAGKMTYDKIRRHDLKEGDILIFNGTSYVFSRYSKHFDAEARSGNSSILFNDGKEVLYGFSGVWEMNNEHTIPYDHVYVLFNKK